MVELRFTRHFLMHPEAQQGERIISEETSRTMRQLLRLVVTAGTGTKADVPGYDVGGKTGTAEKAENGSYAHHQLISSFCGVFPIDDPQFLVFLMLDEPHGNRESGGFATGGETAAPAVGRIIARDRAASGSAAPGHLCRGKSLTSSHWDHIRARFWNNAAVAASVSQEVKQFRGIAADSREVQPGFLFAALAGTRTSGARYIEDAVKRGAVAVLADPECADTVKALGIQFIPASNPRQALARMAAEFYGLQPSTIAAVTGTNGKTSVAAFVRQIWTFQGRKAASLGTVGIDSPAGHVSLGHTTPDPVRLHAELARLKQQGVDYLAMEASSHGLDQYRLDGLKIAAAGFTNHHARPSRLPRHFRKLSRRQTAAVFGIAARVPARQSSIRMQNTRTTSSMFRADRRLRVFTVGRSGTELRLVAQSPQPAGQSMLDSCTRIANTGSRCRLPANFRLSNALVAAGLALAIGDPRRCGIRRARNR